MKLIKFALKLLIALVVLSVLAVVGLLVAFNPNDYKPQIIQVVKDQTGRTLSIEGDIGISFFPRLGFSMGHTELSNADGFQSRVFAEVDEIDVGLQIKPLFMGKVELDELVLNGMSANLEINTDGSTNWDDLAGEAAPTSTQPAVVGEDSASESQANTELPPIRFQGIRIADAQVSYTDKVGGTAIIMEDFNFSTGVVKLWDPIDFEGSFRVENKYPQLDAKLNYSGTLIAKVLENQFGLKNFKLALDAAGEPIPNGKIVLNMGADISANTQTEVAELEQLSIHFDDTTISGTANVNNFSQPAVKFAVNVDQLNADRYIPQAEPTAEGEAIEAAEPSAAPVAVNADTLIELPMQTLRDLNVDGEFTVGAFQAMNLKTQNFKAVLSAHNGVIELKPLGIEMYEGVFDGAVKIDARKDLPAFAVQAKLANMQVNPLMVDFAEFDMVEGAGAFDLNITTQGDRVSQLKRGLNGTMSAVFADGVIKANLFSELSALLTTFGKAEWAAKIPNGKTTPFNALKVSGEIVDGKISTNDLNVDSDGFAAHGAGSFDIPTEYVDMSLTLMKDQQALCSIPIKGRIDQIDYVKASRGAAGDCAKDAGKAALQAELDKAKAKLEAEKAKLKAEFEAKKDAAEAEARARLEAEKKRAEEKLKNKLKDKLKGLF